MKRKLVFYILCFFAGEGLVLLGAGAGYSILLCLFLAALLFIIWPNMRRLLLAGAMAFLVGTVLTSGAIDSERSIQAYGNRYVEAEGIVVGLKGNDSFVLAARGILYRGIDIGHSGRVLVEAWDNSMFSEGCRVRVRGTLERGNGGQYNNYIRSIGVRAVILSSPDYVQITDRRARAFRYYSFIAASRVRAVLEAGFSPGHAEVIKGMLLGGREVTIETRERFSMAGISHLLAVSGLHVGIITSMLIWVSRRIGLSTGPRFVMIGLFLLFFCFMTGLTPSVVRASIMVSVFLLAGMVYRKTDGLTSIAFAASLLSMANPFVIYNLSFQLSFFAVLGIIVYYPFLNRVFSFAGRYVGGALSLSISAQLLLIPIMIRNFEMITPVSVITNIVIIPLSAVIIWLAVLYLALAVIRLPLAGLVPPMCGIILDMMDCIIDVAGRMPFGNIEIAEISDPAFVGYYILAMVTAVIVNPAGIRPRKDGQHITDTDTEPFGLCD
jgi:competence protein ComEC